jgi:hypothetical protein
VPAQALLLLLRQHLLLLLLLAWHLVWCYKS